MRITGTEEWIPASVPGSVYNDLINAGRLDDPYWRDNELKALKLMENDFEYVGSFDGNDWDLIRFNGIDTLADIYLNDRLLGSVDNMHCVYEYEIKEYLKPDNNTLKIVFHSPTEYIARKHKEDPLILGTEDAMEGFPFLRKAHYMFGWDWGPRLPDAGIWRDVELISVNKVRFTSVYIRQEFNEDGSEVRLIADTLTEKRVEGDYKVRVEPEIIKEPKLWWPNNLGDQPLYEVTVTLEDEDGQILDRWNKKIGIRTLEVSTEDGEFAFTVNGVKFFAMGADYIPEDNILSRTNKDRTRDLINKCKASNFNSIRVWGGGIYPSDDFYDACDEAGLVVWQDLMFACANYRLTPDFEESIEAEVRDNIRRLRHHPSLGLWCGNNEMEMFVDKGEWGAHADPKIREDYLKMYEDLFPRIMKEEDPVRFYWPASPSCGGGFDDPNSPDRGDVHYWDVWHGNKPFTEYRKYYFRFLSEFGFQSFPSIRTIESFTLPKDRNVFSYVMEKHQRNASANGKIMNYMEQYFLYPNDLETLVYASQLLQAEAIRYGVEHLRRNRGRCMGAVYWQLNDCWPVASWASVDYYGRLKALHYYAKRFFDPVIISCEEEGLLNKGNNVNAEDLDVIKSIRLNVTNETGSTIEDEVVWELRDADGSVLRQEKVPVKVEPFSSLWLDKIELPEVDTYGNYVSYRLGDISEGTVLFCPPKHFRFTDPKLKVEVKWDEITVTSSSYAKGVEIRNGNDDLYLTDNFFDMNGGTKTVRILSGSPEDITVRSVYSIR